MTSTYTPRLDFAALVPEVSAAMSRLERAASATVEPTLRELVKIHAAQINGCAYCVDMHTKDARAAGETEQRLYAIPVWREAPFFTERERAALAFTEAVTVVSDGHVPDEAYADVAKHFDDAEIAGLISVLVAINAWTRIGAAARPWEPGSYQP